MEISNVQVQAFGEKDNTGFGAGKYLNIKFYYSLTVCFLYNKFWSKRFKAAVTHTSI